MSQLLGSTVRPSHCAANTRQRAASPTEIISGAKRATRISRTHHTLLRIGIVLFFPLLPVRSLAAFGQSTSTKTGVPDLSGLWLRLDAAGSGSFKGLEDSLPKPEFVHPQAANGLPAAVPPEKPHGELDPYIVTHGECDTTGAQGLLMMGHPAALDIVQTKDEVVISSEVSNDRFLYLDGRSLPAPGSYDYSPVGYSVGHWDGDVLAVETVGFRDPRTSPVTDTHLFERYILSDGGERLSVTFTWVDPKLFLKPWTYSYTYQKLPPGSYAFEEWCDSGDPLQTQSIIPPKQN